MLGLQGWYSTNILGNRDGEVLDDPGSFKTKEETISLRWIRSCSRNCTLICTKISISVRINYYSPRGDAKEGWITSTSSDGWVIRCRSSSTSFAGIPSWRLPSCSTWCYCFDPRNAPA